MVVYVAPLVLRGLQNEALNSNVLTHYSLERRTSENTGVRSTERVVSFQCISVEINFDILPQGLQSFASQRALRAMCVLEASGVNLYSGGVCLPCNHSLLLLLLSRRMVHPGCFLWPLLFF